MARNLLLYLIVVSLGNLLPLQVSAEEQVAQGWKPTYVEPPLDDHCNKNMGTLADCVEKQRIDSDNYLEKLIASISSDEEQSFKKMNALWHDFRNSSCQFEVENSVGDNSQRWLYELCLHSYNESRIEMLSKYKYCADGGSCSNDFRLFYFAWPPNT